jgi:hypothetical protein
MLEVYHHVRNRFGPEQELQTPAGGSGDEREVHKQRFQDIFIQFTLANIGGVRAENIKLSMSGELRRDEPREDLGGVFRTVIPQLAPGQTHFLFIFQDYDLLEQPKGGGKPPGFKTSSFTIRVEYDAPKGLLNWLLALPGKRKGRRRYTSLYTFVPEMVAGDLPPPEYAL